VSVRYATLSTVSSNRGPKGSQLLPPFRRRESYVNPTMTAVTLSPGATAHTKTAWVQAVASTSAAVGILRLRVYGNYTTSSAINGTLIDIGVGAAGSEVAVASNIAVGGAAIGSTFGGVIVEIPLAIPAGSRVSLRAQSQRTNYSFSVNVALVSATDQHTTPAFVDVLGTNTANSGGTAMSGGSGSYVQIAAETIRDYQSLIVVPSVTPSVAVSGVTATLTVATGPAGAEVDRTQCMAVGDFGLGMHNAALPGRCGGGLVPAGARISVKHNMATPGWLSACVIGVPYA
jgi:hypothetical protein